MLRTVIRFLILIAGAPFAAGAASFAGVGFLPGFPYSDIRGMSMDGLVVVGSATPVFEHGAIRRTSESDLTYLGDLPGGNVESDAYAASGDGSTVVGWSSSNNGTEAFLWTQDAGMQGLGSLGDSAYSVANAVSRDGSVVVGESGGTGGAFRWDATNGMQDLGTIQGYARTWATGVSGDGSIVVGGAGGSMQWEAFRWDPLNGMQGLGDLAGGGIDSVARAISADGSTIVGSGSSSGASLEAWRWTADGGMQSLGFLEGGRARSLAFAVSADGSAIVGSADNFERAAAFLWTKSNGMQDLTVLLGTLGIELSGWQLTGATAVSADGLTIAGRGIHRGRPEGWIAVIPEPGPALLLGIGFTWLGSRACSTRRFEDERAIDMIG